jgi:putative CocE/NonD family hydrolase
MKQKRNWYAAVLLCAAFGGVLGIVVLRQSTPVSAPGQYRGYSKPRFSRIERISNYIVVDDGTRLAADIFLPVRPDAPSNERFPVIWTHTRYHRARVYDGKRVDTLDYIPWLNEFVKYGYVVATVDARGTGASFGVWDGPFTEREAKDAFYITEWLARQPWSDGRIGMFGASYMGITQFFAAGMKPPHLKAIFPQMASFDSYATCYENGIPNRDLIAQWSHQVRQLDRTPGVPVDDDRDGEQLKAAHRNRRLNRYPDAIAAASPFRDSQDDGGSLVYTVRSPGRQVNTINESGIPVYQLSGWYDIWVRDALRWHRNLTVPRKMLIGPWPHTGGEFDQLAEHLRWFDYWLKGIENGVMDEAPIHYYVLGATHGSRWRSSRQWPIPNRRRVEFYFQSARKLATKLDDDSTVLRSTEGQDKYIIDYRASSGTDTRWANVYGGPFGYKDSSRISRYGLSYTSQPLSSEIEVVGHPVVKIWTSCTAPDCDVFAYLEKVNADGHSEYVTEGRLRASHRALATACFDNIDLPYHRSYKSDVQPLSDKTELLCFDMFPTAYLFPIGSRLRVTIVGADRDNARTPIVAPAPEITIYRTQQYRSHISLPVIVSAEH